jgi:hypothetical protein
MNVYGGGIKKYGLLKQVVVVVGNIPHASGHVLFHVVRVFTTLKVREILHDYGKS